MGLTHSWRRLTELPAGPFAAAVQDIQHVLTTIDVPLAGFEGTGQPIFERDTVVFNGANGVSCEPFEIHQVEFDRRGRPETFSFCKTQGLPYDLSVKVALIVFKHHLGNLFTVMSDEADDAWDVAKQTVVRVLQCGGDFNLEAKV